MARLTLSAWPFRQRPLPEKILRHEAPTPAPAPHRKGWICREVMDIPDPNSILQARDLIRDLPETGACPDCPVRLLRR